MKIRQAVKMAVLGAVIVAPVGMALARTANTPLSVHGNWTIASDGTINASNPTGMTCAASTNTDVGFMQRTCTDSGGTTYIQTINADGNTGDSFANQTGTAFFGDESFVVMGSQNGGGLSGKQKLTETSTGGDVFVSNAGLNTGGEFMPMEMMADVTAGSTGVSMIELDQSVTNSGQEFDANFNFDHGMVMAMSGTNMVMGKFALLDLRSNANDTANGFTSGFDMQDLTFEGSATFTAAADPNAYHKFDASADLSTTGITQSFKLQERSGAAVGAGSISMPNGTSATYAAGDFVARLAIGQDVSGAGVFGLTDFANETTTTGADNDSFITSNVPFGTITGSDPFGTF